MNMHSDYSDTSDSDHHYQSPAKRRRVSMPKPGFLVPSLSLFSDSALEDGASIGTVNAAGDACEDVNENIGLSATSKQAGQTVAPFLARHIPDQYAPMGGLDAAGKAMRKDPNTKFCYRHRPDLKCRRQVNEPSMDQLQHVRYRSVVEKAMLISARSSKILPQRTNKPSLMYGPSFRLHQPSKGTSSYRAYSHNVVSLNSHIYRPAFANSYGSTFCQRFQQN